jgi:hypothetical protein
MSHDPTEHVQEHITHEAAHGGHEHGGHASKWITAAALTAAFLAAFAAVAGALATTNLTESTHRRIDENDKWSYYQSKSLKNYLLEAKNDIVEATVPLESVSPKTKAKIAKDKKKFEENEEIKTETSKEAKMLEVLSQRYLATHETFEFSATMFHIAIAIVAIAVVAKRKEFWYLSMLIGLVGLYFFTTAVMHQPAPEAEHGEEHTPAQTAPAHTAAPSAHEAHPPAPEHSAPQESAHPEPAAH